MRFMKPQESQYAKLLAYADAGNGKTRFAGTAEWDERSAPALHIDVGGNTESMADYKDAPMVVKVSDNSELNMIYDYFARGQPATHKLVVQGGMPHTVFKTVIIDGITDVQRGAFDKQTGSGTVGVGDLPPVAQLQHYRPVLAQMITLSRKFYQLPVHVIITALEKGKLDEAGNNTIFEPLMSGDAGRMVASYALTQMRFMTAGRVSAKLLRDMGAAVGNTSLKLSPMDTVAFLRPMGNFAAKDQMGLGVPFIINPTMTQILDLWDKKKASTAAR